MVERSTLFIEAQVSSSTKRACSGWRLSFGVMTEERTSMHGSRSILLSIISPKLLWMYIIAWMPANGSRYKPFV